MKKNHIIRLVFAIAALALIGCSQTSFNTHNDSIEQSISITKPLTLKNIRSKIIKVGKKNGWLMTEFEENKILAEKITNNTSYVTTIFYDKKSFYTKPENSALNEILSNTLNTK